MSPCDDGGAPMRIQAGGQDRNEVQGMSGRTGKAKIRERNVVLSQDNRQKYSICDSTPPLGAEPCDAVMAVCMPGITQAGFEEDQGKVCRWVGT